MISLKDLFSRKPKRQTLDPKVAELLQGIVETEAETVEMLAAARADAGPSVALVPAVPLPTQEQAGWFGGAAALPKDTIWPDIDGTPLCFVAQIDLTQLPQNIWSSVGPRQGQLVVFMHPERPSVRVLHVDGALETRQGPSPNDAHWVWRDYSGRPPIRPYLPQWPIKAIGQVGALPKLAGYRKGEAEGFPHPFVGEELDLTNPAHHPFDAETLTLLIEDVDTLLASMQDQVAKCLEKQKLRDEDAAAVADLGKELVQVVQHFATLKADLAEYQTDFDAKSVVPYLHQINDIAVGWLSLLRHDDERYIVIEIRQTALCDRLVHYLRQHESMARYTYIETPDRLSPAAVARFETRWQFDALHEQGGMSHPPAGFLYTPFGPASPNEVLLELPTSELIGWMWGDMYTVVLTIPRDDLAAGCFDNITVDITN